MRTASAWTDARLSTGTGLYRDTSVSAYGPTVICAHEYPYEYGSGIRYATNYTHGSGQWYGRDLAVPNGVTVFGYFSPRVDARNGLGTALIYQAEIGELLDPIYYRYRMGYAPGNWSYPTEPFNDFDTLTGSDLALSVLSRDAGFLDHGAIYLDAERGAYFDRPGPRTASASEAVSGARPLQLRLAGPHPASGPTSLCFTLGSPRSVRLQLFDVLGRPVTTLIDGPLEAGAHTVALDARRLASGTYFCRLTAGDQEGRRRVIVVQ
jgi:hypothetical protein